MRIGFGEEPGHAADGLIGTIRTPAEEQTAKQAGAHEVLPNDAELPAPVKAFAPQGIDHIVEVAFGTNIERDVELLTMGESIATYATDAATVTANARSVWNAAGFMLNRHRLIRGSRFWKRGKIPKFIGPNPRRPMPAYAKKTIVIGIVLPLNCI